MSVSNKSNEKSKRYPVIKANDFVNKTRPNEANRPTARSTQGWANLGRINNRRIPPPANVPSLKSETGTNLSTSDPTKATGINHGWSANGNQTSTQARPSTPSKQPTQQQMDSITAISTSSSPLQSSTSISADTDKPRLQTTWSSVTSGNSTEQPPNLLALNDFPRLATQENKNNKSTSDSLIGSISTTTQGPSLRPANLASWKEGGGRAQPQTNDLTKDSNDNNLSSLNIQSQILPTNSNLLSSQMQNPNNSSYMRMYQTQPSQMWSYNSSNSYNSYGTNQPMSMHQLHHQQRLSSFGNNHQSQTQQRHNTTTGDYKTPTILRNKDIDELSKLTDNVTWTSASQEINYEEKIRFSDDEDNDIHENTKPRRFNNSQQQQTKQTTYPQVLQNTNRSLHSNYSQQRSRLLPDDKHLKQMQDNKNSELINTLSVAKQRRDEQERNLRDSLSQRTTQKTFDEQKQIPGYQTRPLHTATGQENLPSPQIDSTNLWEQTNNETTTTVKTTTTTTTVPTTTSRIRHDTTDSQTFAMKNWSDQMDEFNYASLHEKSGGQVDNDDTNIGTTSGTNLSNKFSRSHSESSSQSQVEQSTIRIQSKHFPLPNRKTQKSNFNQSKTTSGYSRLQTRTKDVNNYYDNNEQSTEWEDTNNRSQQNFSNERRRQQSSDDLSQKTNHFNEYNRTKQSTKTGSNASRPTDNSTTTKVENKTQPAWRPLSPARPTESNDPTPQEAISYKLQPKHNEHNERKSRYTTPINTSSIPPLMSVRSDVPPTTGSTGTSKHYKTSNQSQRQDYNSSTHYSQRNDFYNETNDSTWGNDDEYYDDDTGYYDSSIQTHQRHYHPHLHHRDYTAGGSYGRYRRGDTFRHQHQYNNYTTMSSSQINTNSKPKKTSINTKKPTETTKVEQDETLVEKSSPWTNETSITNEKVNETPNKNENETNLVQQNQTETTPTNKKQNITSQRKTNKDQQNYHQDQHYSRHRNTYTRSMQDYEAMQIESHDYYSTNRRTIRGVRNLSNSYYYGHSQPRYNNRYNYTKEHYQQPQQHSKSLTTNRPSSSSKTTNVNQTTNLRHPSASDNELKEGEEWETASESSANMRNAHHDNNQQPQSNETKPINRDRTPPKKSFSNQRPTNSRQNENGIHRRSHNIYDRTNKTTRSFVHRSTRLTSTNQKQISPKKTDGEIVKQTLVTKKDQHRHSLDGYDLNNVAGVVKIETLPAGALEEENGAFDDGGEKFCVVMSKRGRKEQKAAQLSKQNALETTNNSNEQTTTIEHDEQQTNEIENENNTNETNSTRPRTGKSLPPRFNSKSSTGTNRQHNTKTDHQNSSNYYYDQNYYYYGQNQYYDHDGSYYKYGNYNQSHRQSSIRRKPRNQQHHETNQTDEQLNERKIDSNATDKNHSTSSNVMSNIQMWDPQTDSTITNSSKLIGKHNYDRKFPKEIVVSSSTNETSLSLHQRTATELSTHSPVSKTNETIVRTIKPPIVENKSDRENKTKTNTYEKTDTISSIGSNQLFEKNTFLDYDDKQSIGAVGDDYNQKINSLKTIWDASDHPSGQLEQTINTMVAMQQSQQSQPQESNSQQNNSNKSDGFVQESIGTSTSNKTTGNSNVSSTTKNDDTNSKNSSTTANLQSTGSSSTINQSATYSSTTGSNKNEQKNICTVKPTQQVPPNIQDQVDVTSYQPFPTPPVPPPMSQPSLQQQQQHHILPQSQANPLHQPHSFPFYENLLPGPPPSQQQPQYNRYPTQNYPFRNTNLYMAPPNVPNTNSMYHHTSQGSISGPPQNNTIPPSMASYPSPFLVDHGGHIISQPQPPPQAYMNNQIMSGRPQGGSYYRTPPQQQLQTPPAPPPPYNTQDPLAHGGYFPSYFPPQNSNAPPVGHPAPHNMYGQNEGFPHHPTMFARGGSMDRGDHPLMSQPPPQSSSRPANYPSTSSNQQQGPPPSLLAQNIKPYRTNQQQTSSSNQAAHYSAPLTNQYNYQQMPIGAMNTTNNRQPTPQIPSLMSNSIKNFQTNGNNLSNTQSLIQHRPPSFPPQSNMNHLLYPQTTQYTTFSKSTGPNDDNVKPKHI